jgi:hypothetical protein
MKIVFIVLSFFFLTNFSFDNQEISITESLYTDERRWLLLKSDSMFFYFDNYLDQVSYGKWSFIEGNTILINTEWKYRDMYSISNSGKVFENVKCTLRKRTLTYFNGEVHVELRITKRQNNVFSQFVEEYYRKNEIGE